MNQCIFAALFLILSLKDGKQACFWKGIYQTIWILKIYLEIFTFQLSPYEYASWHSILLFQNVLNLKPYYPFASAGSLDVFGFKQHLININLQVVHLPNTIIGMPAHWEKGNEWNTDILFFNFNLKFLLLLLIFKGEYARNIKL